jgi:hypothetical protein
VVHSAADKLKDIPEFKSEVLRLMKSARSKHFDDFIGGIPEKPEKERVCE